MALRPPAASAARWIGMLDSTFPGVYPVGRVPTAIGRRKRLDLRRQKGQPRAISRHWTAATMVDAEIVRLIATLRAAGRYDDTLIVFATDHGESIGIHGGALDKGGMAYEELYRIPMIVKLTRSAQAGTTREQLVSLIDLAPTSCEAADGAMTGTDGVSQAPILEDAAAPRREHLVCEDYGHRLPAGSRILRSSDYKYVLNAADVDELYDRAVDPHEMHNLVRDPGQAGMLNNMRAQLLEHLRATGDNLHPSGTTC